MIVSDVVELDASDLRPIATIRVVARPDELSRIVPALCGEVWQFVKLAGIQGPGRLVAVYHDDVITLEVGVEVPGAFDGNERVRCSSLPAGPVASTVHIGDYSGLGGAHDAIRRWASAHGRTLAGPRWEVYGHGGGDPSQARTDVFYLLKS